MDKSSQHLKEVEHEIDQLERGFCMRLCCSSKSKKSKSKNISLRQSEERKSNEHFIEIEHDPFYTNEQFQDLNQNLQQLQYFNTLIDQEIHDQLQTLVCSIYKLLKDKNRRLFFLERSSSPS
jgi:hypothetical protein